ncbi:unnamed protein product [Linum trigynum]
MRDSVVPLSASSSQLYNFGNSSSTIGEVQVMPSLDISSFCWDSSAFTNYQLEPPAGFHITPHQPESFNVASYDPSFEPADWYGYSPFSACDSTSSSDSIMMSSNVTSAAATAAAMVENGMYSKHGRKRAIEVSSRATKGTTTAAGKRKKSSSATNSAGSRHEQQQMNDQSITTIQEFKLQVPARRSQKLSDKITALQKLVSPYGKTDTASVLQEASLYIKLLQKQIQMLSKGASSSSSLEDFDNKTWTTTIGGSDGELSDLRNRGLCLVPLSMMTRKFADQ